MSWLRHLIAGPMVVAALGASLLMACGGDDGSDPTLPVSPQPASAPAPAATLDPATTVGLPPTITWIGPNLQGDTVVLADDGDDGFVSGVPAPIAVIAGIVDCESIAGVIDHWTGRLDEPGNSTNASAYVAAALARSDDLGCERDAS